MSVVSRPSSLSLEVLDEVSSYPQTFASVLYSYSCLSSNGPLLHVRWMLYSLAVSVK